MIVRFADIFIDIAKMDIINFKYDFSRIYIECYHDNFNKKVMLSPDDYVGYEYSVEAFSDALVKIMVENLKYANIKEHLKRNED